MYLFDVTHKDYWVNPKDAESYDILQKAKTEVGARRFGKDCDILDVALDDLVSNGTMAGKLIFTKAGFLVGHKSAVPHVDVNHIWDTAEMTFSTHMLTGRNLDQANELQLKFVGGLVRWRISLRTEKYWLVYRRDSGTFNKYTGKEITISEYWISPGYQPPMEHIRYTIKDLKKHFNGHLNI
jgi:hypothetical protein